MQEINYIQVHSRKRDSELIKTYSAFYREPSTMRMIEVQTGILRPNICRYVARLIREGRIRLVRIAYCPHTKHLAGFYCTNPEIYKHCKLSIQYQLF